MRQLKFRAWDSKNKKFPFIGFHIIGETTAFDLLDQYSIENFNDLEVSQFTGYQDSKGKDLYEGDFFKACDEMGGPVLGKIEFVQGAWRVIELPDKTGINCIIHLHNWHNIGEVIGNCFEHPNMLNQVY